MYVKGEFVLVTVSEHRKQGSKKPSRATYRPDRHTTKRGKNTFFPSADSRETALPTGRNLSCITEKMQIFSRKTERGPKLSDVLPFFLFLMQ
jgi:hypothetical protein